MSYTESEPVIIAEGLEDGRRSGNYFLYPSNGTYVRGWHGMRIGRSVQGKGVAFVRHTPNGMVSGNITDEALCDRINEYFVEYYQGKNTNCSAFAHFLFTGEFKDCGNEEGLLVAEHHMRNYRKGQPVSVGDMLCLMYCKDKHCKSRKFDQFRHDYLAVRKLRHDNGKTIHQSLRTRQDVVDPQTIRELHQTPFVSDFHFMVCVAKHHGQPVWLSQMGRRLVGDDEVPFYITIGDEDPNPDNVLLVSLIKRRK